jgi:hypothetical protein
LTLRYATKKDSLNYFESLALFPLTPDNKSDKDNGNCVTLKFNAEEWEKIERGAKWLYAEERISKPTPYRYLKWCGITFSNWLEKRHSGDN